jgi:RNA polymerase sigma-70 factor (ECF subfamily)
VTSPGHGKFATTRWSVVIAAAADTSSSGADAALATLCETYWFPLYAYLRGHGHDAEDAQDLTQAFFARLLEKHAISQADPARGRFRSFLLASLKHFAANERERSRAEKRGGGIPAISLAVAYAEDRYQLEASSNETPDRIFDRRWASTLLARALSRLEADTSEGDRRQLFEALRIYLTGDQPELTYAETAARLGMSEGAVKVAVHRLRRKFRDLVRDEIAQTVAAPEDIDDELRHLWSAAGR